MKFKIIKKNKSLTIILGIFISLFVVLSVWRVFHIPTGAMAPTIPSGSKIISQRYLFKSPQRGDVVIFSSEDIKLGNKGLVGKNYIQRLMGLPGDKVEISGGKLIINDEVCNSEIYYTTPLPYESEFINTKKPFIIIPENCYFVLGDNSRESLDSRYFGPIPVKNVWARMIFLVN